MKLFRADRARLNRESVALTFEVNELRRLVFHWLIVADYSLHQCTTHSTSSQHLCITVYTVSVCKGTCHGMRVSLALTAYGREQLIDSFAQLLNAVLGQRLQHACTAHTEVDQLGLC
jgi:hypothetical protein